MQVDEGQLKVFLLDAGLITRSQLADLSGEGALYDTLVRRNVVAIDELRRAAAHATGTNFVVIEPEDISAEAILLIPEPVSRMHNILAYRQHEDELEIALLDLDDMQYLAELNLPYVLRPRLTSQTAIKQGLLYYQKILRERFGYLLQQGAHVVDALIQHALLSSAHGIHIDINASTLVRYRIGTALREAMQLPTQIGVSLVGQLKVLAKLLPTSSSLQEGRFKFEKDGEQHTVHVSSLITDGGERLVLRLVRDSAGVSGFALTSLGFHGDTLEQTHALLQKTSGLIVVAGPSGAGKTTTLYTLLDQLNHTDLSIATIEEKIEHRFAHVAQTQTKPALGLTPVSGLRAILKQDPDVVMVGDIQDGDTASLAAHAANLGTLVLVGVAATNAGDAVEKLLNMGVPANRLAAILRGVIAVDTVKRLCKHKKEQYSLSRSEGAPLEQQINFGHVLSTLKEEKIVEEGIPWKDMHFYRAVPCAECGDGYKGVVGVQEILRVSGIIKEMILQGASGQEIEGQAVQDGMTTLAEDGLFKAAQGETSVEEVSRLIL